MYYTRLGPFASLFHRGTPALMYHKLGPRPRGVRLKGLYVSTSLFEWQMEELAADGFASCDMNGLTAHASNAGRRLAITFDDGFENVFHHGMEPLAGHGFKAIQFLVAGRLGGTNDWDLPAGEVPERLMDIAQVREWLDAGHEIGSHTMTHPWLTRIAPEQAREEITASRKRLEDLFGVPVRHFCYPYGDWSPETRTLVAEAGYASACTTEFGVNDVRTDRFGIKRVMARYCSLRPGNFLEWFRCQMAGAR